MSLAKRLVAPKERRPCIVQRLRNELPIDELTALDAMLDDPKRWPHQRLQAILRAEGHTVSDNSIAAHRAERCCCFTGGETK